MHYRLMPKTTTEPERQRANLRPIHRELLLGYSAPRTRQGQLQAGWGTEGLLSLHAVSGGKASESWWVQLEEGPSLLYQVGARSQSQYLTASSTLACAWASPMLSLLTFLSSLLGVFKTSSHCIASTRLNSLCRTGWHGTHRFLVASVSLVLGLEICITWPGFPVIPTPPPHAPCLHLSPACVSPHFLWYLIFEMMSNASLGGMTTSHLFYSW